MTVIPSKFPHCQPSNKIVMLHCLPVWYSGCLQTRELHRYEVLTSVAHSQSDSILLPTILAYQCHPLAWRKLHERPHFQDLCLAVGLLRIRRKLPRFITKLFASIKPTENRKNEDNRFKWSMYMALVKDFKLDTSYFYGTMYLFYHFSWERNV